MQTIQPRKSLYEVRFFPILETSSTEEQAVITRKKLSLKDWAKNNSTICLFDKRRRERMIFESGRIAAEIDRFTVDDDRTADFKEELQSAYESLEPEKLLRVSLREWYAVSVHELLEQDLVKRIFDRFYRKDSLELGFGTVPNDTGVVFEWDSNKWWYQRRIEFGAMPKSEWLGRVKYFEITFEDNGKPDTKWTDGLLNELPPNFVYIDIDTYWLADPPQGNPPDATMEIPLFFAEMEKRNRDVIKRIVRILSN